MPPIVGFQTYLSNAQRLISQDEQPPKKGEVRLADRTLGLNGHTITALPANGHSADIDRGRRDFIESFVEQFGEECRSLVESALLGKHAKPLTARMIVALNEQALALKPSDLSASLSDLLRRAAQQDAGGVTYEQFQALVQARPELRASLEPLNAMRKQAEEALARLGAFTGAEIAAAFRPGAASSKAEQELADGLRRIFNRHGDPSGALFSMITRCDNRAMEVERMVVELSQLDAASDDSRLSMYAAELLPKLALQMHGTGQALDLLRMSLQPLADRFDSIRAEASRGGNIGLQDVAFLLREISVARAALDDAALLDKLQADVHKFTVDALEERAKNWVNGVVPTFSATKLFTVYREVVKDVADDAEEMEIFLQKMEAFRLSALAWTRAMSNVAAMTTLNASYMQLEACMKTFRLASSLVSLLLAKKRPKAVKNESRSERTEELKEKVAALRERFQKLGEVRLHELEEAAAEDRLELEKVQHLLESHPGVLDEAVHIQRLYDLLVGRREEREEEREADGSGV